jgi:CheY-like chemotaxis protein
MQLGAGTEWYRPWRNQVSKKIMVIDDKPEELLSAVKAVEEAGYVAVPVRDLWEAKDQILEVDGVITDLHFAPKFGAPEDLSRGYRNDPPVSGLLIVIAALCAGKPVIICTNGKDFECGHHGKALSFICDGFGGLGWTLTKEKQRQNGVVLSEEWESSYWLDMPDRPFGINEDKSWRSCVALLDQVWSKNPYEWSNREKIWEAGSKDYYEKNPK